MAFGLFLVAATVALLIARNVQQKANERSGGAPSPSPSPTPTPLPKPKPKPPAPSPYPSPPKPKPGPGPSPKPTPKPPGPTYVEIQADWQDLCWWTMDSPPEAYLELNKQYRTEWFLEWSGDEPVRVYMEPLDLATVEVVPFVDGDEVLVNVYVTPKRRGWGTLMALEGVSGAGAVKGETPWHAQCMKIEVV